ncbi:phage tail tape measure protein [Paraburkholderia sp. J8-2]|uniref:phage tail tape measure protein n=1 Tax=Paraburkholderia sp. J8-2 TaxID=2805440 RepID=UPI002AB72E0A|nr:phage tail tape measure protein [Paraburkholderia sp. J8-2]
MSNQQQTQYDLTVNADGVESGLQRAKKAFSDYQGRVADTAASVKSALDQSAAVTEDSSARQQRAVKSFIESLARQADSAGKSRSELLSLRAAQLGVADSAQKYIDQIKATETATNGMASATHGGAGAMREMMVMAHEAATGNFKRLGGSAMVLTNQMQLWKLLATPAGAALSLLAAAAITVGTAMAMGAAESAKLDQAIQMSGDYAGTTAGQINTLAKSLSSLPGGEGTAQDVLAGLISSGKVSGDVLEAAAKAVMDYAKATGQSAEEAQKALEPMFDDPLAGSVKLNESMHQLTPAIYDHIKALQESGDKQGALKVAMEAVDDQASKQVQNVGTMAAAWRGFVSVMHDAWSAMKDWGKADTDADLLTKAQKRLDEAKADYMTHGSTTFLGTLGIGSDADRKKAVEDAQKAVDDAQAAVSAHIKAAQDKAAADEVTESHIRTETMAANARTNAQKLAKAMQDANDAYNTRASSGKYSGDQMKQFAAERDATIAAARKQYSSVGENSSSTALAADNEQIKGIEKDLAASLERIKALHESGKLDAQAYVDAEYDARKKALLAELAIEQQEVEAAKGKKQTAALAKYKGEVANTYAALENLDKNHAAASQAIDDKRVAAVKAYTDALGAQLQTQQEQANLAVAKLTMGPDEARMYDQMLSIQKDYNKKSAELDKELTEGRIDQKQYDQEKAALTDYYNQSVEIAEEGNARIKAANADWTTGATKAIKSYSEEASNVASQVSSAFSDVFRGMEDAFVTFCNTGTLHFGDLAKSVITDIERMAAKAAISGLFNWAASAVSSYFGGGDSGASAADGASIHLAGGGSVAGPGTSTSDSIPAMLSDGEYVLNAATVKRIGVGTLDALNSGAHVHAAAHYATGGAVGSAAAASSGSSSVTNSVSVTVDGGGAGGLDKSDAQWLKTQVQALVDSRIAAKMKGQGGYAWQLKNGAV